MAWLSLFGEKGAWSEIVWFVAQAHTLKGGYRTWSCCKDRLMETTAVSLVETETAWNSHSVCDHVILFSPLLFSLTFLHMVCRSFRFSFSFRSHASFPASQEREGDWVPWGPMPALVQLVEVRECIQAGAVSFVQGRFLKSQYEEGGVSGAVTDLGSLCLGHQTSSKTIK